jgi:hypothetical protein
MRSDSGRTRDARCTPCPSRWALPAARFASRGRAAQPATCCKPPCGRRRRGTGRVKLSACGRVGRAGRATHARPSRWRRRHARHAKPRAHRAAGEVRQTGVLRTLPARGAETRLRPPVATRFRARATREASPPVALGAAGGPVTGTVYVSSGPPASQLRPSGAAGRSVGTRSDSGRTRHAGTPVRSADAAGEPTVLSRNPELRPGSVPIRRLCNLSWWTTPGALSKG